MYKWKATLPLLTISTVQYDTHMISESTAEYLQDSEFAKQFQSPKASYALRDGRLYRDRRFCVGHDAVSAGRRGATMTIKTLQNQYYWGSLSKDVCDNVGMCYACQRAKSDRRRRACLFTPHAPLFGPGLIRTEVCSRDGALLQTASRHSHPVDKYGLCGTRLINHYFVETNRSMVVRRRCTQTMSRQVLSGGHRWMFCARDV
jgi:hypothetical protein